MVCGDFNKVCAAGKSKMQLLNKNPIGYFISSMLAGLFVGLSSMLIYTIGGQLTLSGSGATKIIMGLSFGGALSLVIMAGGELFTGNNFVLASASLNKDIPWKSTMKLWVVCFLGNLLGSIIAGGMFTLTGLATGSVGEYIAKASEVKMTMPLIPLFFRGVFCNILVCLATWCGFKCKEEVAKLIMIFWCLFIFITVGFEHSVANMTVLTIGLLSPFDAYVTIGGYIYNILVVTFGNMVGGILFVALPYYIISREKK
jgi:nitrite transporter NirC